MLQLPILKKFSQEQTNFLKEHLALWWAMFYAENDLIEKGGKKEWVIEQIYPNFASRFYPDDNSRPCEEILKDKLYRWFLNHKNTQSLRGRKLNDLARKPRAINGLSLFAQEKRNVITEKMSSTRIDDVLSPSHIDGLSKYRATRKELWEALDAESQAEYQKRAAEKNKLIDKGPTEEDIQRNQDRIIPNTMSTLRKLTGRHWGGHGDVAFFILGAVRQKDGHVSTFHGSVANGKVKGFESTIPDYVDVIRRPFKEWAMDALERVQTPIHDKAHSKVVQGHSSHFTVSLNADGHPTLPPFDPDEIAPREAKALLQNYIVAAWNSPNVQSIPGQPVPWQLLHSRDREDVIDDFSTFVQFNSLDPAQASTNDIYGILKTILLQQQKGNRPLQFSSGFQSSTAASRKIIANQAQASAKHKKTKNGKNSAEGSAHGLQINFSPPKPGAVTSAAHLENRQNYVQRRSTSPSELASDVSNASDEYFDSDSDETEEVDSRSFMEKSKVQPDFQFGSRPATRSRTCPSEATTTLSHHSKGVPPELTSDVSSSSSLSDSHQAEVCVQPSRKKRKVQADPQVEESRPATRSRTYSSTKATPRLTRSSKIKEAQKTVAELISRNIVPVSSRPRSARKDYKLEYDEEILGEVPEMKPADRPLLAKRLALDGNGRSHKSWMASASKWPAKTQSVGSGPAQRNEADEG
ncbi:hypothetical protein CVT26_004409 [Gymnopilus dilepis]|uniref:Uncharacterized protein n=1 Tax=Gymnopilus dilepis TaxID=231916 RepID=A0A409WN93_9AGAR|nr:hypothetical protein CVT26_004409 [Gymnopilus dilepis]